MSTTTEQVLKQTIRELQEAGITDFTNETETPDVPESKVVEYLSKEDFESLSEIIRSFDTDWSKKEGVYAFLKGTQKRLTPKMKSELIQLFDTDHFKADILMFFTQQETNWKNYFHSVQPQSKVSEPKPAIVGPMLFGFLLGSTLGVVLTLILTLGLL